MDSDRAVQFYNEAIDAVEHRDAAPAFRLLKGWEAMVAAFPLGWTGDAQFQRSLPVLKNDLRYTAFPELPLADAQKILSSEILGCLRRDIDLGDLLDVRYTFLPYGTQEKERLALKEAILSNTEMLGGMSIGEWLNAFDRLLNPETREENGVNDFMVRESRVASLGKAEQAMLRIVLDMYDKYLATELFSLFDLAMLASDQAPSRGVPSQSAARFDGQPSVVRLPLLQALSKYENLGNQLITRERIRIKSQQEPVRPSLLYWIKYYRDELGIGHHNSVERGNFLFRSENGKQLSAEERERVNLVLKSVEENYPVDIDTERSEIVFPPFESQRATTPRPIPAAPAFAQATPAFTPMAPAAPTTLQPGRPNPMFHFGQGGVSAPSIPKQASSGTLSFTSKHVFPAEKSAVSPAQPVPSVPPAPAPGAPRAVPVASPKGNPFHIRPVSLGERDKGNES